MSLNIEKKVGEEICIILTGRLDTSSSPDLEKEFERLVPLKMPMTVDMKGLDYISSAGLRVILITQKNVNANGTTLKFINVNDIIMDIFEMTGFVDILTIER